MAQKEIVSSIIIVNYNGGEDIIDCLDSIHKHTNLEITEIILVDNASTDGSIEHIQTIFPECVVKCNLVNCGFGRANNIGAQHARGKYFAFLNPDIVVKNGWLQTLISVLEQKPQVGLVSPKILLLTDPSVINSCGHHVHWSGLTQCRGFGAPKACFTQQESINAISGAAFVMREDLYKKLGGFDESFFMYNEDTDISWRAQLAGYKCYYVPDAVVYHNFRLRLDPEKLYHFELNRYQLIFKHFRWKTLVLIFPMLLLVEIVAWGFILTHVPRASINKLRSWIWIGEHWQDLMRRRKRVQADRKINDRILLSNCAYWLEFCQVGSGILPRLGKLVFNPQFYILKKLYFLLIWW